MSGRDTFDLAVDIDWSRREDETPSAALIRSVLAIVEAALDEEGLPLTGEQRRFLHGAYLMAAS